MVMFRSGVRADGQPAGRQQLGPRAVRLLLRSSALAGEESLVERCLRSQDYCLLVMASWQGEADGD